MTSGAPSNDAIRRPCNGESFRGTQIECGKRSTLTEGMLIHQCDFLFFLPQTKDRRMREGDRPNGGKLMRSIDRCAGFPLVAERMQGVVQIVVLVAVLLGAAEGFVFANNQRFGVDLIVIRLLCEGPWMQFQENQ